MFWTCWARSKSLLSIICNSARRLLYVLNSVPSINKVPNPYYTLPRPYFLDAARRAQRASWLMVWWRSFRVQQAHNSTRTVLKPRREAGDRAVLSCFALEFLLAFYRPCKLNYVKNQLTLFLQWIIMASLTYVCFVPAKGLIRDLSANSSNIAFEVPLASKWWWQSGLISHKDSQLRNMPFTNLKRVQEFYNG